MTRVHPAVDRDDSLEREYFVLATQHQRISQSYHALAQVLARKRAKRVPSTAKGKAGEANKPSLPFPESELF